MSLNPIYVVTDIETDGPCIGENSMLSFASVAVAPNGTRFGEFETVLAPAPDMRADPETLAWFQKYPEAWAATTKDPKPPAVEMARFAHWVRSLPGDAVFVAHPLAFDGLWIDWYLKQFAGEQLMEGPWKPNRLFRGTALCLASLAFGRLGLPPWQGNYRPEWLGNLPHTHCAIDDARGYANLLITLLAMPVALT